MGEHDDVGSLETLDAATGPLRSVVKGFCGLSWQRDCPVHRCAWG
jgi:hypothetical protein